MSLLARLGRHRAAHVFGWTAALSLILGAGAAVQAEAGASVLSAVYGFSCGGYAVLALQARHKPEAAMSDEAVMGKVAEAVYDEMARPRPIKGQPMRPVAAQVARVAVDSYLAAAGAAPPAARPPDNPATKPFAWTGPPFTMAMAPVIDRMTRNESTVADLGRMWTFLFGRYPDDDKPIEEVAAEVQAAVSAYSAYERGTDPP